jgi:uncharacterized protein (UPF0264 family)
MPPSKLLISLQSADEILEIAEFDFPWIDLKDPTTGSLGCPQARVAEEFVATANRCLDRNRCRISLALGELIDESWTEVGSIVSEFDFAKVALAGCASHPPWKEHLKSLTNQAGGADRVILVHYADSEGAAAPDWPETLEAAIALRSRFILVDTFDKSAGRLWDWYSPETIRSLAMEANANEIQLSIAGSLRLDELSWARNLGAAIIGVRGAACQDGSRVQRLCRDRLGFLSDVFSNQAVTN